MEGRSKKKPKAKLGWLPRIVCIMLPLLLLVAGCWLYCGHVSKNVEEAARLRDHYQAYADDEALWIMNSQLDNGALPHVPITHGQVWVNPYFSLNAALALVAYGSPESLEAAKNYLKWHCEHMNAAAPDNQGLLYTIYDHTLLVEEGRVIDEKSNESYDSADSYAALLIKLLHSYTVKTGEHDVAAAYYGAFSGAVDVLEALMNSGLTYATIQYPVFYLMDNCEVYAGLCAAAALMEEVYIPMDDAGAMGMQYARVIGLRDEVGGAIEDILWNPEENRYEYAVQGDMAFPFDQGNLYPEGVSQLSPILWGVSEEERSRQLYETFCQRHQWWNVDAQATWGMCVYAAAILGDMERTGEYFSDLERKVLAERAYPYYNGEAACILQAALACVEHYQAQMDKLDPLRLYH